MSGFYYILAVLLLCFACDYSLHNYLYPAFSRPPTPFPNNQTKANVTANQSKSCDDHSVISRDRDREEGTRTGA